MLRDVAAGLNPAFLKEALPLPAKPQRASSNILTCNACCDKS